MFEVPGSGVGAETELHPLQKNTCDELFADRLGHQNLCVASGSNLNRFFI